MKQELSETPGGTTTGRHVAWRWIPPSEEFFIGRVILVAAISAVAAPALNAIHAALTDRAVTLVGSLIAAAIGLFVVAAALLAVVNEGFLLGLRTAGSVLHFQWATRSIPFALERWLARPGLGGIATSAFIIALVRSLIGSGAAAVLLGIVVLWLGVQLPVTMHYALARQQTVVVVESENPRTGMILSGVRGWWVACVLALHVAWLDEAARNGSLVTPDGATASDLSAISIALFATACICAVQVALDGSDSLKTARWLCALIVVPLSLTALLVIEHPERGGLVVDTVMSGYQAAIVFLLFGPVLLAARAAGPSS